MSRAAVMYKIGGSKIHNASILNDKKRITCQLLVVRSPWLVVVDQYIITKARKRLESWEARRLGGSKG
jgi:hypothetical protein